MAIGYRAGRPDRQINMLMIDRKTRCDCNVWLNVGHVPAGPEADMAASARAFDRGIA